MTNAEFYKRPEELKAAHEAFRKLAKDMLDKEWVRRASEDPYFYAVKSADLALQPGLAVGSLVKIVTNLSGEGLHPHYAVVTKIQACDCDSEYVKFKHVMLKFANGSSYRFEVKGRIWASVSDESKMEYGDIKACDIPAELLGLVLEKCPLKKQGACMEA